MRLSRPVIWLLPALLAGPAQAHAPIPGIEGFYVGLLHPFSTPSQAVLMVGVGLVIGGFATGEIGWNWGSFAVAVLAGLFAGPAAPELDAMLFAAAFATCTTAALFPGRLKPIALVLIAMGGFLIGTASIPDAGEMRDRVITMSGSVVGANIGLLYIFGTIQVVRERYTWPWIGIAFRILAAWLGAISLLMLALETVQAGAPG